MAMNGETIINGSVANIDVLVVGGGIGGFFCAIEMHRQGYKVRLIEAKPAIDVIGDFVALGETTLRQFKKWPDMVEKFKQIRYLTVTSLYKFDGEYLGGPFRVVETTEIPLPVHRAKLSEAFYDIAKSLGIPVHFGHRVCQYNEANDSDKASVLTESGETFEADLIVAADGVGSSSWKTVQGERTEARGSGFAIYRVAMPTEVAHADVSVQEAFPARDDGNSELSFYLAPDAHAIVIVSKDITTWLLTHRESGTSTESWSSRVSAEDVIEELKSSGTAWDPKLLSLIKQTPANSIVDWRLMWRDPVEKWVSDCGHIVQLGDSAHTFLPTSANGATQAGEDAISLAACLKMAGGNVSLATKVHNTLRFERVACCQRWGFRNREKWHHTDFEDAKRHPEKFAAITGRWITEHDPEQYVYDNWETCVKAVESGIRFTNTNIPPGYTFKSWTIDELLNLDGKNNATGRDEGDWS